MEPPVSASNKTYKIISYDKVSKFNKWVDVEDTFLNKYILSSKKTWQGALEACHVLGLELASINTEEEEENMINLIYSTGTLRFRKILSIITILF